MTGNGNDIAKFSEHPAFSNYFRKAYYKLGMNEKIEGLKEVLEAIDPHLTQDELNSYWDDFGNNIVSQSDEHVSLNNNHKAIFGNASTKVGKKVMNKLIGTMASSKENNAQGTYGKQIIEIEKFLDGTDAKHFDLYSNLPRITFKPDSFLEFIEDTKKEFGSYNIICKKDELYKHFLNDEEIIDVSLVSTHLRELEILKSEYDLSQIITATKEVMGTLPYNDEAIADCVKILKSLSKKPLGVTLDNANYSSLNKSSLKDEDLFPDIISIGISEFSSAIEYTGFQSSVRGLNEDDISKITEQLEWYISYGDLLELLNENSTARGIDPLRMLAIRLTKTSQGISIVNLDWVLKNFTEIVSNVFSNDDEDESLFMKRLDGWEYYFETSIEDIDEKVFNHIGLQELKLVQKITSTSVSYLRSMSKDEWETAFINGNRDFTILQSLIQNNVIDKFTDEFYSAYSEHLEKVATGDDSLVKSVVEFWDKLIPLLNGNKLKSYFTSVRDILLSSSEISDQQLYFLERGLIKYGNLHKKSDDVTLKILMPMIRSDESFEEIFLSNVDEFVEIIKLSELHIEAAVSEIQVILNEGKYDDNNEFIKLTKAFKLTKK